jgi:hypothetical protein
LDSLGNFEVFKEVILAHKNEMEGNQVDLTGLMTITAPNK